MENQGQKEPKASPPDTPLSPVSNYSDSDSNEPKAPNTSLSPEQGILSSSESSEEEAEVHLPDTFSSGVPSTTNIPGLGRRLVVPRIGQQGVMIPGIGSYVVNPPTMSKQGTGLLSNTTKHYGDFEPPKTTMVSTSKPFPGVEKEAANPPTMSKQETGLPSRALKHDGDFKIPTATVSDSKPSPGIGQPVAATQPVASIFPGQKLLPSFSDIPKSARHKGYHEAPTSEKAVASGTLPSINPQSTATSPDTGNFKFTLNAQVPHEPGHSPATERFSFTQESKARLEEIDLAPVRRPAVKPTIFTKPKDPAQPHHIPFTVSALIPGDKPSVAEASTLVPQAKKPDEVPVFVPIKTSLPEPSNPANQAKKPIEEPKLIPIKPPLAKPPAPTRQASQPTESPQFPEVKPPVKPGYKRSTTKDVERQEGKADADKKVDPAAMRELLAEKRELRSQRDALAREKSSLETRLNRLTDEVKNVEGREEETRKAMSAKSKEYADLKTENERLKNEMEVLSLLPAPKPEQEKASLPAQTEISENSTVDGDLLAEKAAEIDALKDENKQLTKRERDLKASTTAEVLELKAKLTKAEDGLNQKKKDDENTSKRMDRDVKKIKDLSDELTKFQISKSRIEAEFKAQTVTLNKVKTREAVASSKENELRQSVKESKAEAKLAEEQAEKLNKELEASKVEIKAAKAQNDKMAKDIERSCGLKVTAPASSDPRLRKIETSGASQTPPNRVEGTNEGGKQEIRDYTAENEALLKNLEVAGILQSLKCIEIGNLKAATTTQPEGTSDEGVKQKIRDLTADVEALQEEIDNNGVKQKVRDLTADVEEVLKSPKSIEIHSLKAATNLSKHEEVSSEEEKQKICDLTAENETLRKELEETKLMGHVRSIEADNLEAATSPTEQHKETSNSEEDKQNTRKLTADNEALREEINELKKTSNEIIDSLTVRNNSLAEDCQEMKNNITAQTDKVGKLSASNEELVRKLKISEEVEARALRNMKKSEETYAYFDPFRTTIAEQEGKVADLRAKLAEEVRARQKSDSLAKLLERKLDAQLGSLREVAKERAELMGKVIEQQAELAKYQDARKSVTVEAELEVTKTTMENYRVRLESADAKRADELNTTLGSMNENERLRRQELTEALEAKSRSLLDAKEEISKLKQKLAASNEATEAAIAEAAAASASASPNPSQSSTSSPTSETSSGSGDPSLPNTTTTIAPTTTSIQMNLSPRRLIIFLFILGLAFLAPYNHSRALGRQSTEERDMWRAADEISRREIMNWSLRDQGEEARVVANWDRYAKAASAEP